MKVLLKLVKRLKTKSGRNRNFGWPQGSGNLAAPTPKEFDVKSSKKLYTVTDLGGGDGGKGGVVHKLCDMQRAHTVVKVGGAQGSHGVKTTRGQRFNFCQFGCGTFGDTKTHLSRCIVVDPNGLLNEANQLMYAHGVRNAFDLLTVDEDALCVTPYHGIASRLREYARKENPKGTIGTGVGEAFFDRELFPDLAIHVRDILGSQLLSTLRKVRDQKIDVLQHIIKSGFFDSDQKDVQREIELLYDDGFAQWTYNRFREMASKTKIVDTGYLGREILSQDGTVVVESSHGILTDRYHGFHPHTSKIRTLPRFTHELLREAGYDGRVINLGVTRAYQIRHGAGPMVTESPEMVEQLLPGSSKDENRFQGKVRVGPLDLVALRYSIDVCGGSSAFDGLAITWFDQMQALGEWNICDTYIGAEDREFFSPQGEIHVRRGEDNAQLVYQEQLGNMLRACTPTVTRFNLKESSQSELIALCSDVLKEKLSVPVRMMSFGSTEDTKVCF